MTDAPDDPALDRVLTVPNALSVLRLGLLAAFGILLFGENLRVLAAATLGLAGVTDFLDGYVARHFHQVSTLGKVLDPTVDRIVLAMSVVSILAYGAVPVWLGVVVIAREVLVSGTVLVLAGVGARRIDVLWLGKAGTFGLMCCFPLFLGAHGPGAWTRVLGDVTWVCVVPALALSLAAAAAYVPQARRALAEGRHREASPVKAAR